MSNELAKTETTNVPAKREYAQVRSTNIIMDSAFYDHIYRIANLMAVSGMMPDSLAKYKGKTEDGREAILDLPREMVLARAFMIAEVAARIEESPFTLMQHVSYVHGKIMYEAKIIHAVLQKSFGINLSYEYGTWDAKREKCDTSKEGEGDMLAIVVSGDVDGKICETHGNVGGWKTTGSGSPWRQGAMRRQLAYRGAREFMRMHKPAALLGILSDDEELPPQIIEQPRRKVSEKLAGKKGGEGFSIEHVRREMGDDTPAQEDVTTAQEEVTQTSEEVAQDSIPGEPEAEQTETAAQLTNSDPVDETEETPNQEVTEDGPQATQTEDADSVTAQNGTADNSQDTADSSGETDGSGQTVTNDASPSDAFKAFEAGIDQAKTWAEIDGVFMALFATDDWKYAEEWERRAVRVTMWERVAVLRKETNTIIVDPRDNAKAFLCWLDCAKAGDEKEVNLLFGKLQATPTYKKFNDAQRAHIEAQVTATIDRIGRKS